MKNIFPTFVFACCWTVAQSTPPASQPTEEKKPAAIRGIVRDQTSGNPIADVRMTLSGSLSGSVETSTDGQGHFAFNELRPGQYEVVAQVMFKGTHHPYGPHVTRHVDVQPGQTLESFDLRMPTYGKISGKVVDQNGEPVANVGVSLIARVYSLGALRYRYFQQERTDDRGMYSFSSVPPRQSYLIYANSRKQILDAASQIPVDPKLRKRAIVPTFYPFSGTLEGAAPITLSPGESREAVDIILARTPSYCMESKVPADLPQGTSFSVAETQPAFGFVGDSGILGMNPGGTIPADHKLRICDLHPGEYQFELMRASSDPHVPAYYS
ncbi:MAG: carboxypeptidase-like regulatory domain-containing protein, partial [Bryobacteraceae bacterium]